MRASWLHKLRHKSFRPSSSHHHRFQFPLTISLYHQHNQCNELYLNQHLDTNRYSYLTLNYPSYSTSYNQQHHNHRSGCYSMFGSTLFLVVAPAILTVSGKEENDENDNDDSIDTEKLCGEIKGIFAQWTPPGCLGIIAVKTMNQAIALEEAKIAEVIDLNTSKIQDWHQRSFLEFKFEHEPLYKVLATTEDELLQIANLKDDERYSGFCENIYFMISIKENEKFIEPYEQFKRILKVIHLDREKIIHSDSDNDSLHEISYESQDELKEMQFNADDNDTNLKEAANSKNINS